MENKFSASSKGGATLSGLSLVEALLSEGKFSDARKKLDEHIAANGTNEEANIVKLALLFETENLYKVLLLGADIRPVLPYGGTAERENALKNASDILSTANALEDRTQKKFFAALSDYIENAFFLQEEASKEDALSLLYALLPALSKFNFDALAKEKYASIAEKIFLPKNKRFPQVEQAILARLNEKNRTLYAKEACALGELYLHEGSFAAAEEYLKIAEASLPTKDKHKALFLLLLASLRVKTEEEFVKAKGFKTDDPIYQKLLVCVKTDNTLNKKYRSLAQDNITAHTKQQKPPKPVKVRPKRERKKITLPPIPWKKLGLCVGVPICAIALVFCFFRFVLNGHFVYTLTEDGTGYSVGFKGWVIFPELTIPKEHKGLPVVEISDRAFQAKTNLKQVHLPDSVTTIGELAFDYCISLKSINIPDSVTSIENYAFQTCSSLTSFVIPESVTTIGEKAFYECDALASVSLPDTIQSVGKCAFCNCISLSYTVLDQAKYLGNDTNPYVFLIDAHKEISVCTLPDSVKIIGNHAFPYESKLTSITIPDTVVSIGEDAFKNCKKLTSVYISDVAKWSVIDFTNQAANPLSIAGSLYLDDVLLTSLVIPDGLTTIKKYAFAGCKSLTSVTVPDSISSFEHWAFHGCDNLKAVYIDDIRHWCSISTPTTFSNPLSLAKKLYLNGSLVTDLVIPDGVTSIGAYAFYGCEDLTSVSIPDSVIWFGDSIFRQCTNLKYTEHNNALYLGNENNPYLLLAKAKTTAITSCDIHPETKWIQSYAFYNCTKLASISIREGVLGIGSNAFSLSGLERLVIADSVTTLGEEVFSSSHNLEEIVIGKGITTIGADLFLSCPRLKRIKYRGTQEQWESIFGTYSYINLTYNYSGN